jgi:hypothetical protein
LKNESDESDNLINRRTHLLGNKKIPDVLDFFRGILKDFCRTESYLELSSDDFSIIFTISFTITKIMTKDKPCILCNVKTK